MRTFKTSLLLLPVFLMACSDAADMPVAAPGNDIVAGDAEGVVMPEAIADTDIFSIEKDAFSADYLRFPELEIGMDSDEAEPLLDLWAADVDDGEVRTSYREDGRTIILATRKGLKDDSVSAEQIYTEFTPVGPLSNQLDFAGLRFKCARGPRSGEWTTELCP